MEKYWLRNPAFDLAFLIGFGLLTLLLVVPYRYFGATVVIPIYTLYLVGFGLPHNYLTWATILPASTRRAFQYERIWRLIGISLAITLLLPFSYGTALGDWVLSGIALLSIWHVFRQHYGIGKIYDSVQARRFGDPSLFADRRMLDRFFTLASLGVIVWVFTFRDLRFLMSADESYRFVHPVVPVWAFHLYLAITGIYGLVGLKRTVWDRWRRGAFLPWPQLLLMTVALASFWLPYAFIPISAMPLAMAIATIFHNVQYFAFIWIYEGSRSSLLETREEPLQLPQRLARHGRWLTYFGLAAAFSVLVGAVYLTFPKALGIFVIYFIGVSHYLVDGFIWKSTHNRHLPDVLQDIAGHPVSALAAGNLLPFTPTRSAPASRLGS